MYVVLRADMAVFIHSKALIHVANKPYDTSQENLCDTQVHLTNVSKNHHNTDLFHGCPVVHLETWLGEEKFARVRQLFHKVFESAQPFMRNQVCASDFSHIGADVMFDTEGHPYLLELNIPPCIGNYKSEMVKEQHDFFNGLFASMMTRFVHNVLSTRDPYAAKADDEDTQWLQVSAPRPDFETCDPTAKGLNTLAWRLHLSKFLKVACQPKVSNSTKQVVC